MGLDVARIVEKVLMGQVEARTQSVAQMQEAQQESENRLQGSLKQLLKEAQKLVVLKRIESRKWVSTIEAAIVAGVTREKMKQLCQKKVLKARKVLLKSAKTKEVWRIYKASLMTYLEGRHGRENQTKNGEPQTKRSS